MLRSLYLQSYAWQIAPMLISGTTELAAVQLVLKFLGWCWWELISCHSQRPVYSFDFCFIVMSNVNRGWNPASQKGAWGKLLERFPKTVVVEPPLAHLQIMVALFWKTYELLQILLKSLKKWGPEVTVSRSPPLISNPACSQR